MRVYVFVMLCAQWFTQVLLAEDMRTSISSFRYLDSFETVVKAVRYLGATDEEVNKLPERTDEIGRDRALSPCFLEERTRWALSLSGFVGLKCRSDTKKNPWGITQGSARLSLGIAKVSIGCIIPPRDGRKPQRSSMKDPAD